MDKAMRILVRGAYDVQKLRISAGNRIVGNFRAKLGQSPGEKSSKTLDKDALDLLRLLAASYKRIADALVAPKRNQVFIGDAVISTFTEFSLLAQYVELEAVEREHFKRIRLALADAPIYVTFLKNVKGIGPAMAGVLISEIDIEKARHPSSLWAYAGLDVASNGAGGSSGRSKRKEHLVRKEYVSRDGEIKERDSITYNPWLKSKLMGVLGASFLKSGSPYAEHYKHYRHRIETDPAKIMTDKTGFHTDNTWTKMRRHKAATRYMIKMFLLDLYLEWRKLEGLPVSAPYSEAKQGHKHKGMAA